jgi:hypothetical protein
MKGILYIRVVLVLLLVLGDVIGMISYPVEKVPVIMAMLTYVEIL